MTAAKGERQLVVFSLHGEHYGLPITTVREIIRYVAPSATAAARGIIQGMISLRGRTLPIVDLSSRLGQSLEVGSQTRILVLEVASGALGLVVDNVDGIHDQSQRAARDLEHEDARLAPDFQRPSQPAR